jgi:hypothetical protein
VHNLDVGWIIVHNIGYPLLDSDGHHQRLVHNRIGEPLPCFHVVLGLAVTQEVPGSVSSSFMEASPRTEAVGNLVGGVLVVYGPCFTLWQGDSLQAH